MAAVLRWRCEQLGALLPGGATPVIDAMFSRDEPHTSTSGTLAWAVDVDNPATGEAFTLMLKEVTLPTPEGGTVTRPCAVAFSGNYPKALDGLARVLSLDMRVIDPAWIGMKLRKLLNYAEPLGHFMAFVPGEKRQQTWPSTVAYVARLIIHRYAMLGVLDDTGQPLRQMGVLETPDQPLASRPMAGKPCPVRNATVIPGTVRFLTSCGGHAVTFAQPCLMELGPFDETADGLGKWPSPSLPPRAAPRLEWLLAGSRYGLAPMPYAAAPRPPADPGRPA
jgi:ribonucleoside-diphosphate reductase alpha chain